MVQQEFCIPSTLDRSLQPSLFYAASEHDPRPLLVGLHTWSFDRFNQIGALLPFAEKLGFHLLLPQFRGPNLTSNPDCTFACGSVHAMQDILDAIAYVMERYPIDPENLFLLGNSGGGHMALMMAGYAPERFKAIASFVPITDLNQWKDENANYANHILACCSYQSEELCKRSPISYLDSIAKANVKLFHGKYDPVVPVHHSIDFFNAMMRLHPTASVYLDVFDGGHELDLTLAQHWFLSQLQKTEKINVTG